MKIVHGSLRRWVPLAVLALFAAAEFAAQYLFIATPFAQAVGIPDSALRFIEVRVLTCSEAARVTGYVHTWPCVLPRGHHIEGIMLLTECMSIYSSVRHIAEVCMAAVGSFALE